jgi:hypothetical protein
MFNIKKSSFAYYNLLSEDAFKEATLKVLKVAREDGEDDRKIISVICFSALEYGLKSELMTGAYRDLDSFRSIVDKLIDHLVGRDPDVMDAIEEYKGKVKSEGGSK